MHEYINYGPRFGLLKMGKREAAELGINVNHVPDDFLVSVPVREGLSRAECKSGIKRFLQGRVDIARLP